MSKSKKARLAKPKKSAPKTRSSGYPDQNRSRSKTNHTPTQPVKQKAKPANKHSRPQSTQTGFSVPFRSFHKILLVGEGDFSFSTSLLSNHSCTDITATTFESQTKLLEKHPQASKNVELLKANGGRVFYSIDATALLHPTKGGGSNLRKLGPFDYVVFNFPHTGGLTKDVNRQVRANQELCVKFLESACKEDLLRKGGRVVVTLFEGEPYELWGIRNLARHVGLMVVRSSRFEWDRYPGYSHARTLGNLKGSGWKGESRAARMYIFGRPGEDEAPAPVQDLKRKRSDNDGEDSDEDHDGWETDPEDQDGGHLENDSNGQPKPPKEGRLLSQLTEEAKTASGHDEFEGFDN